MTDHMTDHDDESSSRTHFVPSIIIILNILREIRELSSIISYIKLSNISTVTFTTIKTCVIFTNTGSMTNLI